MPRKRPTPPPQTALDCINELTNIVEVLKFSGDADIRLKLALDLHIAAQRALNAEHARLLADDEEEDKGVWNHELQQLATIEGVLSGLKLDPAPEGQ